MPDQPAVIQELERYRAELLNLENGQFDTMVDRWVSLESALSGNVDALALRVAEMRAAGQAVNYSTLLQLDQYRGLLVQAEAQYVQYSNYAAGLIAQQQGVWGTIGLESALAALETIAGQGLLDVSMLPIDAVLTMMGFAGDGSPLNTLLSEKFPFVAESMTRALINAVGLGQNPRVTAAKMADALGVGLNYALLLARTEQLRAYREASRAAYAESGVVSGYRRLADKSARTCPACLFADGRLYELSEPLDEHPQGRCSMVPVVIGYPAVTWQSGTDWFEQSGQDTQADILGQGGYNAWKAGYVNLEDFIGTKHSDIWGDALTPASLSGLLTPAQLAEVLGVFGRS